MTAIGSTFRTDEPHLHELLGEVHKGQIQLPDFQRGWVWDDDHIRALIASVSLSYPIGAVMLLETGGEGVRFKPRTFEGVELPGPVAPLRLALDGQQRLEKPWANSAPASCRNLAVSRRFEFCTRLVRNSSVRISADRPR